jgi:ATP-binding cassette, subfamily B, bacterial PglK
MLIRTIRAPLKWLPARLRLEWGTLTLLLFAVTLFELLAAGTVYRMVDRATIGPIENSLLAAVAAVFLARSLLLWFVALLQSRVISESMAVTFSRLLAGYLAAPYSLHLGRRSAERIQRLTAAIDVTYRLVMASVPALAGELLVMTGLTALILVIAPFRAALTAAVLAGVASALLIISRKSVGRWGRQQYEAGELTMHRLEEIFAGIREIKSGQREREFHDRATAVQRQFTAAMRGHLLAVSMPRVTTEAAFAIVAVAVVLIVSGRQTLGLLALFAYAGFRLIPSANRVIYHLDHIRHGAHAVAELETVVREVEQFHLPARPHRSFAFRDVITIDDVSFAYQGAERSALRNLSLTIRRGEWIGVAGENGSGKSTLLDIVAGLLQPSSGSVRIDDRPLEHWLATSPPLIGYVSQFPYLLDDGAKALSGGERQRLALANILRDAPEILLLDEPATALDADAEADLTATLAALKGQVTTIVVSHRLETLRQCDRVVELRDGSVYERASSALTIVRT